MGSKNSLQTKKNQKFEINHQKGLWSESVVISSYEEAGWKLRSQRIKIHDVEIDLVFQTRDQAGRYLIDLCEVKSLTSSWMAFERIKSDQLRRLKRVCYLLKKQFSLKNLEINCYIVFVQPDRIINKINLNDITEY